MSNSVIRRVKSLPTQSQGVGLSPNTTQALAGDSVFPSILDALERMEKLLKGQQEETIRLREVIESKQGDTNDKL
jgi:hypothetical protein